MNIVYKSVNDLIPYEKNTKKHDKKQIKNVATSIDKYGFVQPLVIDKNNVVIIGHCRLLGAKQLKMEQVPCVCADDLTEEEVNALRIVDNKSNESAWDMDILPDEIADVDLGDFDFDFGNLMEDDTEERQPTQRDDLSQKVGEMYQIIIDCENELEQEELYYKLTGEGLKCRTLIL
jgi:hypothetical protein